MIDCGASHNFLSVDLVKKLAIPRVGTSGYGVLMGTSLAVKGEGICRGVVLTLQNLEIMEDFLPLELGNANVILGMQWLASLGGMHVNWGTLTTKFQVGGVTVTPRGNLAMCKSLVFPKAMMKAIKDQGAGVLVELGTIEVGEPSLSVEIPSQLTEVLQCCQRVFNWPEGLPPQWSHDPAITLSSGVAPVSVRPYRYPHAQKAEIERLVTEMLAAGIIQPSISPFSSPVLLVKKKDGS